MTVLERQRHVGLKVALDRRFRATGNHFSATGGHIEATGGHFRATGGVDRATGSVEGRHLWTAGRLGSP